MKKIFERAFQVLAIAGLITFNFITPAFAAPPDSLKAVLSDSREATDSTYTITLDQAAGTTPTDGETVTITFPSGFTVPTFVAADVTWNDGGNKTVQDAACGATDTVRITVSGQVVTFEACDSYSGSAGGSIIITLGTGSTKVTNHSTAATYTITAAGTYGDDSKDTLIAVTEGVTLSATVDETLTFTISGLASAACDTTGGTEIANTSSTAINYNSIGTLSSDTFYDGCQLLETGTNASGGYSTTVQTTSLPTSGSDTIAKGSCDGGCSDTTHAAWATAGNNGYGYCMKDTAGDAAVTAGWTGTNECGDASQQFKTVANAGGAETARTIMSSTGAVSGDQSDIGFRLTFDSGQEAGAYTTTIVYICTPTF